MSPSALPAITWNLPSQRLDGLEDAPPVELQLLHECSPSQVSPERLPGSEDTSPLPSIFLFNFVFPCLMGILRGHFVGVFFLSLVEGSS